MTSTKARKIQELRQARGMSEDDLSHTMGVDAGTVRRWESGEEDISPELLSQLADSLSVSQDELRHEEDIRHHGD